LVTLFIVCYGCVDLLVFVVRLVLFSCAFCFAYGGSVAIVCLTFMRLIDSVCFTCLVGFGACVACALLLLVLFVWVWWLWFILRCFMVLVSGVICSLVLVFFALCLGLAYGVDLAVWFCVCVCLGYAGVSFGVFGCASSTLYCLVGCSFVCAVCFACLVV